jgi:hypothetical protein
MMKCENDTHDKEILCPWYESGKPKLSNCDCKFMDDDLCFSVDRMLEGINEQEHRRYIKTSKITRRSPLHGKG